MTKKDVYLLWWKDAEMQAIKDTLQKQWIEFRDAWLWWWASIDKYKSQIAEIIQAWSTPVALELVWASEIDWVVDIDHHWEKSNNPATILQVYERLWLNPDLKVRLIAWNDIWYIPKMEKILTQEWIIDPKVREDMIKEIRSLDREAQWITQDMEKDAELKFNKLLTNLV